MSQEMKVLNLDGFAQVKRQLELKGVKHDVLETNVQQFINNLQAAEALASKGEKTPETLSRQVIASVDAILESVPTLKREDLLARPIEALTAIMKFIRGEMDPDVNATTAGEDAAAEGGDKKKD
jgi:hypothetical protein